MTVAEVSGTAGVPVSSDIEDADLRAAMAAGWADFRAMPIYGLFFALFYVLGGMAAPVSTRGAVDRLVTDG